MKYVKIIIPLCLGLFLCAFAYNQFSEEQLSQIKEEFVGANYFYVGLSMFFGFLSNLSRGLRWQLLLSPLGYRAKSYNRVMAVFVGYLVNVTIPRSGEISRALVVNRYDGVPFDKAFGTIISERVVDFILLMLFTATVFVIQFDLISAFLLSKIPFQKLLLLATFALVAVAVFFWWLYKSKSPIAAKISKFVVGLKEGILSIAKLKQNRNAFIAHTVFIWAMYVLMFYIPFFALEQTVGVSFATVLTAFVVGGFAITFTNGGFGSYPFFIAEILLIFGIPLVIGTAFGWIVWISQFVMMLFFGTLSFILLPILNRKKT